MAYLWTLTRPTYLWTHYIDHPLAVVTAWTCRRIGIGARTLTVLAVIPAVLGGLALHYLDRPLNLIFFLIGLQLCYIADCADGTLARATRAASVPGAYLDRLIDYLTLAIVGIAYTAYVHEQFPGHTEIYWSSIAFFITRALSYSVQFLKPETAGPMGPLSRSFFSRFFGELTDTGLWWFLLPLLAWWQPFWIPILLGALLNFAVYLKGMAGAYLANVPPRV